MTPSETLTLVGRSLYGDRWQTDLAGALNVSDRTMRRWVAGTDVPRLDVLGDLLRLVNDRKGELGVVAERLLTEPNDFRLVGAKEAAEVAD